MEWPVTRILPITVASCAAVAAMIVVSFRLRIRWTGTLTVCVAVACIGSMTAIASDTIAWHDPASAQARQSSSYHEVMATVTTPVIASDQRTLRLSDGHTAERHHCGWYGCTFHGRCACIRRRIVLWAVASRRGLSADRRIAASAIWTHTTMAALGRKTAGSTGAGSAVASRRDCACAGAFFTVTEQLSDQGVCWCRD